MTSGRGDYHTHVVFPGAFSAEECDQIVELGSVLPDDDGALEGADGATADAGLRTARIAWMGAGPETEWIFDRLWDLCATANAEYGFELSGFDEDLQFTTYGEPGAFYTWHQDGLDGPVAHRKLSLVLQLSDPDDYQGAELELFQSVEDLDADDLAELAATTSSRGTVVVFPAFEYHRVIPLVSGVRRSLVSWVSGPPFR